MKLSGCTGFPASTLNTIIFIIIIDEAGGVVGATPEGSYGLSYFVKCENDTINVLMHFISLY